MQIYVDKLPKNCEECLCSNSDFVGTNVEFYCGINNDEWVSPTKIDKNCPLKELTNAQLAVGLLEDNKCILACDMLPHTLIEYREGFGYVYCNKNGDKGSSPARLNDLIKYTWYKSIKPQYTFTDWKGAREAYKLGKKVTIFSHNADCILELHSEMFEAYIITDIGNSSYCIDEEYDSTEWKVWE